MVALPRLLQVFESHFGFSVVMRDRKTTEQTALINQQHDFKPQPFVWVSLHTVVGGLTRHKLDQIP